MIIFVSFWLNSVKWHTKEKPHVVVCLKLYLPHTMTYVDQMVAIRFLHKKIKNSSRGYKLLHMTITLQYMVNEAIFLRKIENSFILGLVYDQDAIL